ncbi:sensor histidine kinase [Diplocloster hominis]|uniref:sensor histidine kinase n=1 Tax=Diplocloster hominis TaxID=3079010 RepID=UPI0031BB32EA
MAKRQKRTSLRTKMISINLGITVSALVLCGAIFAVSVWMIMGKYIDHDIDFFLTETSHNMADKIEYLEQVVLKLRDSDEIMGYLEMNRHAPAENASAGERPGYESYGDESNEDESTGDESNGYVTAGQEVERTFGKVADISSQKNTNGANLPIVEEIYLFSENQTVLRTSYYSMIYSEAESRLQAAGGVFARFDKEQRSPAEDYAYVTVGDRIYLAFLLNDANMNPAGTLIYVIQKDSFDTMMEDIHQYENSFWMVYDRNGNQIAGEQGAVTKENLSDFQNTWNYVPYRTVIGSRAYRVYSEELGMNLRMTVGMPENQTFALMFDSVKLYVGIILLITIAAAALFFFIICRLTRPLKEVTRNLQLVQEGKFDTKLPDYEAEEFYEISRTFNDMTSYVSHLISQVYEKQLSIREMELKFLQSQMNPHFMFNVLNTIALQAKMDRNEELFQMITSFSQLIQAKIYRKDTEKVQMKQELEYVQYYLYLQSFRYGERLRYEIQVSDEKLTEMFIPKLCIQLIVENAVVHGIEPKAENGFVRVEIYQCGNEIWIDTTDNGMGFGQDGGILLPLPETGREAGHNRVGLNNVHHIIQLMYGENYGIEIYSEKGKGSRIRIRIPYEKPEGEEGGNGHGVSGNAGR